jgi:LysM repeat protein
VRRSHLGVLLVGVTAAVLACGSQASAAVSHVVVSGESLSSIALANGISTSGLAGYNGLADDALLIAGQTIQVPSASELGTATSASTTSTSSGSGHVVVSGESLSSIAAANGISVSELASYNGLADDALLIIGQTIQVPAANSTTTSTSSGSGHVVVAGESLSSVAAANGISVSELASYNGLADDTLLIIGQTIQVPAASASTATSSDGVPLGSIDSPYGTLYLRSDAASAWNSMRQASLDGYGVDLYPGGPLSAYRTYDQQAELYQQYLDGVGAPANPPGTSEHNLGTAVDVETEEMRSVIDQIGGSYGWGKISAPDEWWHVTFFGG